MSLPLTHLQSRFATPAFIDPAMPLFASAREFELRQPLDPVSLRDSFRALVAQLDALRTVVEWDGSQGSRLRQSTLPAEFDRSGRAWDLEIVDVSAEPSPGHAARLAIAARYPQPPRTDCLPFRAALVRAGPEDHRLLVSVHHSFFDEVSFRPLLERLDAIHAGDLARAPAPTFADVVRARLEEEESDEARAAVARLEEDAAACEPLAFYGRPHPKGFGPTRFQSRSLGAERSAALRTRARASLAGSGARSEAIVLANVFTLAHATWTHRVTSARRFLVGMPFAGRRSDAEKRTVGLLLRMQPLWIDVSPSDPLEALLARISTATALAAKRPALRLPPSLDPDTHVNVHSPSDYEFAGRPVRFRRLWRNRDTSACQFRAHGFDRKSIAIGLESRDDAIPPALARRALSHIERVIDAWIERPETAIGDVEMLPERERRRITVDFGRGAIPAAPARRLDRAAATVLRADPSAIAVLEGDRAVTRGELRTRSLRLAVRLRRDGAGPGSLVALELARGSELLAAQLAALRVGAAFLPLDPSLPDPRRRALLAASGADFVVSVRDIARANDGAKPLAAHPRRGADAPLYVLYTSGSTGEPKGVIGTHRGAWRRLEWFAREFPWRKDDVVAWRTPSSFVDSIAETFGALLAGVPLALVPDDAARDTRRFVAAVQRHRATHLTVVPSLLRALLDSIDDPKGDAAALDSLRVIVSSGEALDVALARRCKERLPAARLLDLYGSTEVAGDATAFGPNALDALPANADHVPIGRPLDGVVVGVIDDRGRAAPWGARGELVVAGECLAIGYHRPDAESAARFGACDALGGRRAFRTGDVVSFDEDGRLLWHGREDSQVKIRGVRVEPAEVERSLRAHPAVADAAVLGVATPDGTILRAWVVAADSAARATADLARSLRRHLREMLPAAFVPRELVFVPWLPRGAHGKLDAGRLPEPSTALAPDHGSSESCEPGGAVEALVLAAFRDALPGRILGRDDDFFDAGGDSLGAIVACLALERALARDVPPRQLVEHPTAALLARSLRRIESRDLGLQRLVAGSGAPVILFPPAATDPTCFLPLARALSRGTMGPTSPGVGAVLSPRYCGLESGEEPDRSVEAIAARAIRAIREAQPRGPYRLVGRCFGGIVAFEAARQLVDLGETVAALMLIDVARPPGSPLNRDAGDFDLANTGADSPRRRRVLEAQLAARAEYRGGRFEGRMVVFHGGEGGRIRGARNRWPEFAREVEFVAIEAPHRGMMREPFVALLAARIRALL